MNAISIRTETAEDTETIYALTEAAFRDMPFSDGDEPELVNRLRADGDLALSLVAEDEQRIVGHLAISPVTISDGTQDWFGIGPVSVWPELHRQGIGSALIHRGIADIRKEGAKGIVLLGSPDYYSRFGFLADARLTYPGPPPEYFQSLLLAGEMPSGVVQYAQAFG